MLITPSEVKRYSRISAEFPSCGLDDISEIEWHEFYDCLGIDFYKYLEDHKTDLSGSTKWEYKGYESGDIVMYKGIYYTALDDVTQAEEPTLNSKWAATEKFTKKCLNDLWCNVLARYLAVSVVRFSAIEANTPMTASGIVERFGDNFKSASDKRVSMFLRDYDRKRETAWERLKHYMKSNNKDGCFDLSKVIGASCCNKCGCVECECGCDKKTGGNFYMAF